jgi:hypothetical protein
MRKRRRRLGERRRVAQTTIEGVLVSHAGRGGGPGSAAGSSSRQPEYGRCSDNPNMEGADELLYMLHAVADV